MAALVPVPPGYFEPGMTVSLTTSQDRVFEGQVLAFHYTTKCLIIKSPASNGKTHLCNTAVINLNEVKDLQVIKEADGPPPPLRNINLTKMQNRIKNNIQQKLQRAEYVGVGVTPAAQRLFDTIAKTIQKIRWSGKDIVVMDEVTIVPPYRPTDCQGNEKVIAHIRKIVEKFNQEQSSREASVEPEINSPSNTTTLASV